MPLWTYPALVVVRELCSCLVILVERQALPPGLVVLLPQPLDSISVPTTCAATAGKKELSKTPMNTHSSHQVHTENCQTRDKGTVSDFPDLHSSHWLVSALFLLSCIDKAANCKLDPCF